MKKYLEEYGLIIVVVTVILGMLGFGKSAYATSVQNGILGGVSHVLETGENITKESSSMLISGTEFNSKIPSSASSIIFTSEKAPKGTITTDLTQKQDGDVVAWLDGTTWKISSQNSNKRIKLNSNCRLMFFQQTSLNSIEFNNVDTSSVTDMSGMFGQCMMLQNINVNNFDTSNVTTMNGMFDTCMQLQTLNLKNFNTSKVTDMSAMFRSCGVSELDLSSFDTSNVIYMSSLFSGCNSLMKVNLSSFKTSRVKEMNDMFNMCNSLQKIVANDFNKQNVTNGNNMFNFCFNLPQFNSSKVDASMAKTTENGGYFTKP